MSAEDIEFNLDNPPVGSGSFDLSNYNVDLVDPYVADFSNWLGSLSSLEQTDLLNAFAQQDAAAAAEIRKLFDVDDATLTSDAASGVYDPNDQSAAETARLQRQAGNEGDGTLKATGVPVGDPNDPTGVKKLAAITPASNAKTNPISRLLSGEGTGSDLLSGLLAAYMAREAYKESQQSKSLGAVAGKNAPVTATRTAYKGSRYAAQGGLMGLAQGGKTSLPPRYLNGHSDGMADKVPAQIDNRRPAALSDGEFVIPADVVSHLGNGNSNAGAKRLYEMMDRIRSARTGNSKQGKQINPNRFLPR